jgi:Protein of unknown function (DUF3892)
VRCSVRTGLPIRVESPTVNHNAINEDPTEINAMGDFQITCINKPGSHSDPHTRIQYIGQQGKWKMAEDTAIGRIRSRKDSFYTLVNGRRADVVVAERNGQPYLKTTLDDTRIDNLLTLPEWKDCKIIV